MSSPLFNPCLPMLAKAMKFIDASMLLDKWESMYADFKYDGARCIAHVSGDKVELYSRTLKSMTAQFPELAAELLRVYRGNYVILDGEIIPIREDGFPKPFKALQPRLQREKDVEQYIKEIPIEYRVFDLLYLNGLDYINEPYESRRADLDDLLDDTPSEMIKSAITVEIKDTLALESFFDHALTMGQEGVILRDGKGVYRPDKRALVKVKGIQKESSALDTLDCVVLDYTEGKGKFEGMAGSFLLGVINEEESAKMGVTVYTEIGSVGGGITDEERKELTEQVKCCRTKLPDVLLEVAFEEITLTDGRYALRFPRIVRSRTDKISPDFLNKVVDMYQVQVKVRR